MTNTRSANILKIREGAIAMLLLAAAVIGAFSPALWAGFVDYDDRPYILDNARVRTGLRFDNILWAFEGATSYYDNLLVRRAGLMSAARYLTRVGETLTALSTTPGRRVQSLTDASFLSWIKHYRPDENSPNSAISYYLKGEVVALLLDLELRRATQNARSLDDVLRLLWKTYGDERGVPEDGVEREAAAGGVK